MTQSVQISGLPPDQESMDYSLLLARGIQLAQKLSGEVWTDYNEHDPGLTILEQLCYALTDLGYRINYDIADILAPAPNKKAPSHTLYTGDEILPCRPLTVLDYRKLLYDQILGLKNVWFKKLRPEDANGIKGLYEVLVDLYEGSRDPDQEKRIRFEVGQLLNANRNLTEDIHRISILKPKDFSIEASVKIGYQSSPETILAQIIYDIENYLVPYPIVSSVDSQMDQHVPPDVIFTGPLLQHGVIDDQTLVALPHTIKVKDIERIIGGIEDIENILSVRFKDNIGGVIHLSGGDVPRLHREESDFTLIRGGSPYPIDQVRLNRKIASLTEAHRQREVTARQKMRDDAYRKLPQGVYKGIDSYHSIQHHFPLTYGIGPYGIAEPYLLYEAGPYSLTPNPSRARKKREAQARQLKAYLLFFEQVLANAFSQLAHTPQLFSLDRDLKQTYFSQPIIHIPDIAPVLAQAHRILSLSDLKEEMVVDVEGWRQDGRIVARHIRTRKRATKEAFSVVGKIEQVDYDETRLSVYDEPFVWTDLTRVSDEAGHTRAPDVLEVGQVVEVEARRDEPVSTALRIRLKRDVTENGFKIQATGRLGPDSFDADDRTAVTVNGVPFNVVQIPSEGRYQIKVINVIEAIDDDGALTVGGITFTRLSSTTFKPEGLDLVSGMMVEVGGKRLADDNGKSDERVAVRVQVRPPEAPSTFGTLGSIDALENESLTMSRITFRFTDRTLILDEAGREWPRENLEEGMRVEVEGKSNLLVAEHIQTRDPDIQTTFEFSLLPEITDYLINHVLEAQADFERAARDLRQAETEQAATPDDPARKEALQEAKNTFEEAKNTLQQAADTLTTTEETKNAQPQLPTTIDDEEGLELYQGALQKLVTRFDPFLDRRGRMLDHLLARFNERFDDHLLDLLDIRPSGKKDPFYHELIQSKITFLDQYIDLSRARGAGLNLFSPYQLHVTNENNANPDYRITVHSFGIESETMQKQRLEEIIAYGTNKRYYRKKYFRRTRVFVMLVDTQGKPLAYGWIDPLTSEKRASLTEEMALEAICTFFKRLQRKEDKDLPLIERCSGDAEANEYAYKAPIRLVCPSADWPHTSGLERRVRLLLNIDDRTQWPLAPPKDTSVYQDTVEQGKDPVEAFRLTGPGAAEDQDAAEEGAAFTFSLSTPNVLKHVLKHGAKKSSYQILKPGKDQRDQRYQVLFKPLIQDPTQREAHEEGRIVYRTDDKEKAHQALDDFIAYLTSLSWKMEGFYIVEHILLRPVAEKPAPVPDTRYEIFILDANARIRLSSYDLLGEKARDQRLKDILLYGAKADYYQQIDKDHRKVSLLLRDDTNTVIAVGEEEYPSEKKATEGIKNLAFDIEQINALSNDKSAYEAALEKYVLILPETDTATVDPSQDASTASDDSEFYNFKVSVFFPDWPTRFQSNDFKLFAKRVIRENAPAHVAIQVFWLEMREMQAFEDLYPRWVRAKTRSLTDLFEQQECASPDVKEEGISTPPDTIEEGVNASPDAIEETIDDLKKRERSLVRLIRMRVEQNLFYEARLFVVKALEAAQHVKKKIEADPDRTPESLAEWDERISKLAHIEESLDAVIAGAADQPTQTERILAFFNTVSSPEEIVHRIQDDPSSGSASSQAYGIRPTLARRILATRDALPEGRFTALDQIDAIRGVGPDTLHDIRYAFSDKDQPASPAALPDEQPASVNDLADQLKKFIKEQEDKLMQKKPNQ